MGLLDQVREVQAGRKAFVEPAIWDPERLRYGWTSGSMTSEREQIENDFLGYVAGIYKRNGPISALISVRMSIFAEARFMFRQLNDGRPGGLVGGPGLALLQNPWPGGTTGDLLARMEQDASLAGNAYIAKIGGRLRRLRPDWVTIITASESEPDLYGAAIDAEVVAYMYEPQGRQGDGAVLLTPSQVAHYAPKPDPESNWRGMSWITPVLSEIKADHAATKHKLKFFENGASPQVIVSYDASIGFETYKKYKDAMTAQHQGVDNAYKTLHMGGGADAKIVGSDLRQLDFKSTQGAGETRLAAAAGVPSVIVGFSEGLSGSSLNQGNFAAARRLLADGRLRPMWRNAAGSLARITTVPAGHELWFDERDISFLREDARDSAEIQAKRAGTIRQLIDAGYTPDSVVLAVDADDFSLLVHSGLYSVQLQAPMPGQQAIAPVPPEEA